MGTRCSVSRFIAAGMASMVVVASPVVHAQELSGDVRLACEAILCLSSGFRPGACAPSLSRYFGITGDHMFEDRLNFLNLCPTASAPNMPSLVNAIVGAAGRCEVGVLNQRMVTVQVPIAEDPGYKDVQVIANTMPHNCAAYYAHPYVKNQAPTYVGDPLKGGHWQ